MLKSVLCYRQETKIPERNIAKGAQSCEYTCRRNPR